MNFIIKIILLISCFFIPIGNLQSQNSTIDSLKIELQNHKEKDTTRINLLNALAFSSFSNDLVKTLEYLDEADEIAEIVDFKKGKARSIYIRGITEAIQSNYEQALKYYNEALELYVNIDFKKGVANCYNAMGITYKNKGQPREAVSYYKKAISIEEEIGSNHLSASLLNLGTVYEELGDFNEAVLYLKKALSIAQTEQNEQRVAYSLNNLGTVYQSQSNYPLALEHFNKSLYILEKLGDSISIAHNSRNMGLIYKTQKYYDKAMGYYEKSLDIYERMNNKQGVSSTLSDIGTIHEENGDYKRALDHYVDALRISEQIGAKSEIPYFLNNIGEVYFLLNNTQLAHQYFEKGKQLNLEIDNQPGLCYSYLGIAKVYVSQKIYDRALTNALKSKEISNDLALLNYQSEVQQLLSIIYKNTGDYKKALESHQQFKILNDSLFNKENIRKITQLEYEYKYKQELELASLRELKLTKTVKSTSQDLERSQRNLFVGIIFILLLSIISGGVIFFMKLRNANSKFQNILIEQKLLRSQMTPHFIFNSLSVLQGMILNKEEGKSISYLSKFSKLLRTTLENSRYNTVSLSEELAVIDNYMDLQNLSINPPYKYQLTIDPIIDPTVFKIPPMLIQPFVENAFEHAFPTKKDNKEIKIHITFKYKQLICTISDNGVGINKSELKVKENKKSLATTITAERLNMLSKEFKVSSSISVENRQLFGEQGTLVTLVIPYKIDSINESIINRG